MNKKKILKLILATSTVAGSIALSQDVVNAAPITSYAYNSPSPMALQQGQVINVTTNLRVRAGASTDSTVIGYLVNNSTVNIKGESGNWYIIDFNGNNGYVSKDYIAPKTTGSTSTGSSTTTEKSGEVKVSTSLRVRSAANTSSAVLGYLTNGMKVTIVGESGDFYQINYNNTKGYVAKSYITVTSQGNNQGNNSSSNSNENNNSNNQTTSREGQVINITTNLRVRSAANTSSSVLGYLTNGTKVTITGESGDFYQIKYNNKAGYVAKSYIKVITSSDVGNSGGNNNVTTPPTNNGNSNNNQATSKEGQVINVTTNLRVRSAANTSSSVVGYLTNGQKVTITGESGDFYQINYNNKAAYVAKSYIKINTTDTPTVTPPDTGSSDSSSSITATNQKGQVINISTNLRVRTAPNTSAAVLGYLLNGATVDITGTTKGWYRINFSGKEGYVSSEFIKIVDGSTGNNNSSSVSSYNTILNAMKSNLGSPYVWGGSGEFITKSLLDKLSSRYPSEAANGAYTRAYAKVDSGLRAFDCSGLMQWGYAQAGISIGRSTWDQINNGVEVSLQNLQPGDLLFYSSLQHVGMYIGNGQWIESPNKNADVRITNVPWSKIGRARRILN